MKLHKNYFQSLKKEILSRGIIFIKEHYIQNFLHSLSRNIANRNSEIRLKAETRKCFGARTNCICWRMHCNISCTDFSITYKKEEFGSCTKINFQLNSNELTRRFFLPAGSGSWQNMRGKPSERSWTNCFKSVHDGKRSTSGRSLWSVVVKKLIAVMSNKTNATDDFLDYDINESFSRFDWAELGPVLVVYSLTFFLGLIGERERLWWQIFIEITRNTRIQNIESLV